MKKSDRTQSLAWRHLYKGRAWQALRRDTLARDAMACRLCGVLCIGLGQHELAPVVDHITPHKGDLSRFYNPANLQTLCKRCHDTRKRAAELRGYDVATDAEGWPIDPAHPANAKP